MIISQTAMRLSLLGGNTDFREYFLNYGGLVLSTTIDKYLYCIVKKRFDDLIIVNYSIKEIVNSVDDLQHELVRETLKLVGIEKGIEISFLADIPTQGTGLGSSSAVTIGLLNALHTYLGEIVSSRQLADEAIQIELDILGKPIGIQDQHIIATGGFRAIELTAGGDVYARKVVMKEADKEEFINSLMLFYTGITRKADKILKGINVKREKPLLDQNKQLAATGTTLLLKGSLWRFGDLLDTYWNIKKTFSSKISNAKIDDMYTKARKAGAWGGKIVGAGGGGFLLVMAPENKRAKVRKALSDYQELSFRFSNVGTKIIFNDEK